MLPGPVAVIDGDLHPLKSFELTQSRSRKYQSLGYRRSVTDPEWAGSISSYRSFNIGSLCMHERITIMIFEESYERTTLYNSTICNTNRTSDGEIIDFVSKGPIQRS